MVELSRHLNKSNVARGDNMGRVKELEDELSKTRYNKKTQSHIGLIKAKIRVLKEKEQKKAAGKGKTEGYQVRRTGDATVILVGYPSVGKSTLLNKLTNADSAVAAYAFTTLTVIPGLLEFNGARIQILDVPGIVEGAASGRGRGKEVLACCFSADLVLFIIDVFQPEHLELIKQEVADFNLRVNQRRPDVKIVKTTRGGIQTGSTVKLTQLTIDSIESILKEYGIMNADVVIREDISADQLCDVIESGKKYIPAAVVCTKTDLADDAEIKKVKAMIKPDIFVSSERIGTISQLKQLIFDKLRFMRIYCKEVGKKADLNVPLIMQHGDTLRRMCEKLHKDFIAKFKFARIWGKSVKFEGQKILSLNHILKEGDIVEIHLR